MASLGQDLKREREQRSVSLQEIADATKINLRLLEAVEADRFESLPGDFFVKGILRAYAQAIGLDEESVVNRFHQQSLVVAKTEGPPEAKGEEAKGRKTAARRRAPAQAAAPRPARRRRFPVRTVAAAAVVLVLLLAGGAYLVLRLDRPVELPALPRAAQAVPAPPAIAPVVEPPVAEAAKPSPGVTPPRTDGLRLEVAFQAETWIHAAADGRVVFVGLKPAGSSAVWTAESEIILQTGNAGGLTFTINGRRARPLGKPGEVRTDIRIGLDNYRSFLAEPDVRAAEAP